MSGVPHITIRFALFDFSQSVGYSSAFMAVDGEMKGEGLAIITRSILPNQLLDE